MVNEEGEGGGLSRVMDERGEAAEADVEGGWGLRPFILTCASVIHLEVGFTA